LGSEPSLIFRSKGRNIEIEDRRKNAISKFVTSTDPLDEIKYTTKFCLDMQDKKSGGIYSAVNVKGLTGIWLFDAAAEEDTYKRYLNKIAINTITR
jgi:hypothetical protein